MLNEGDIYLGTVAIEPQRWAGLVGDTEPGPLVEVSAHLGHIAAAGFDGVELWERHLTEAGPDEVDRILASTPPVAIFNSYTSLDDPDPAGRDAVAAWVGRTGADGVKFNVGNDASSEGAYVERIAAWLDALPESTSLLCECHFGISIAEDSTTAARIFDAAGPAGRLGAIVHTHDDPDYLRSKFDAYGDRIRHVHVNFLDFANGGAPRLGEIRDDLEAKFELLRSLGFGGTWTIEFCHGLLTENDQAEFLVQQAIEDLGVLREVLA